MRFSCDRGGAGKTTTAAPTEAERYNRVCPDWCTLAGYAHEESACVIHGGQPVVHHEGPTFGQLFTAAAESCSPTEGDGTG
jgi:hypothetical protein